MRNIHLHLRAGGRQGHSSTWLSYSKIIPRYDVLIIVVEILTNLGDVGDCLSDIAVCNVSRYNGISYGNIVSILPIRRR